MATFGAVTRCLCRNYFDLTRLKYAAIVARYYSNKGNNIDSRDILNERSSWVTLTDDGRTLVCWHPEEQFPYEFTKPLPIADPKLKEGDSVLKIQYRMDELNRHRPDGPNRIELQAMTFTTKHRWFPNNRRRFRKPNPPKDREGM